MNKAKIEKVIGREIIDSRGKPTVEAEVHLDDGTIGIGRAPSGASTGKYEACELRDSDGVGVSQAVANINGPLASALKGTSPFGVFEVDDKLISADGTENKSKMGANAILALSIAVARSAASSLKIPLFKYIGGEQACTMPVPMMNILNGGAHASNNLDIQEFMILPVGAKSFREGLKNSCKVYAELKKLLSEKKLSTSVGDEGGFAPDLKGDREALELILSAVERAGFAPGKDFMLALDAASSEWKGESDWEYKLPKSGEKISSHELSSRWRKLVQEYPIMSIEDPLGEEDWNGWQHITDELGGDIRLVGDDLFVTNTKRLKKGIEMGCGNAILIKPNQIGTLSETIAAVGTAKNNAYSTIMSHRSGETEDSTIADLAVALNTGFIKTGAPARAERTVKYNRLLKIEEMLGKSAWYPGKDILTII